MGLKQSPWGYQKDSEMETCRAVCPKISKNGCPRIASPHNETLRDAFYIFLPWHSAVPNRQTKLQRWKCSFISSFNLPRNYPLEANVHQNPYHKLCSGHAVYCGHPSVSFGFFLNFNYSQAAIIYTTYIKLRWLHQFLYSRVASIPYHMCD